MARPWVLHIHGPDCQRAAEEDQPEPGPAHVEVTCHVSRVQPRPPHLSGLHWAVWCLMSKGVSGDCGLWNSKFPSFSPSPGPGRESLASTQAANRDKYWETMHGEPHHYSLHKVLKRFCVLCKYFQAKQLSTEKIFAKKLAMSSKSALTETWNCDTCDAKCR